MHNNSRKNILIVGANGFLGRNLCTEFIKRGSTVEGIIHTSKQFVPNGVKVHNENTFKSLASSYDIIIITAGNYRSSEQELVETNVLLPYRLVQQFPKARIVYISSVAVYRVLDNPSSLYAQSKIAGEFVMHIHKNASVVRLSNLYGYGMDEHLYISTILRNAAQGYPIVIRGSGKRVADYIYIQDAVELIAAISFHAKTGTFLGCYGKSISNNALAAIVKRFYPRTIIRHEGVEKALSSHFHMPHRQHGLAFIPTYSYKEGLKKIAQDYE